MFEVANFLGYYLEQLCGVGTFYSEWQKVDW
jgi:hypothetical protein